MKKQGKSLFNFRTTYVLIPWGITMALFLVAMVLGCVVFIKDFEMPVVYETIKDELDMIVETHNESTFKSKMLKLTINVQHLNRNETNFKKIEE
jgi:hypothetical protein